MKIFADLPFEANAFFNNTNGFKAELLCYFYFGIPVTKTYISKLNLDRDLDRKKYVLNKTNFYGFEPKEYLIIRVAIPEIL